MKKTLLLGILAVGSLTLNSCNELQQVLSQTAQSGSLNVAGGLKQALELGVSWCRCIEQRWWLFQRPSSAYFIA